MSHTARVPKTTKKKSPAGLKQLAVNTMVDSLHRTVKEMDKKLHGEKNNQPDKVAMYEPSQSLISDSSSSTSTVYKYHDGIGPSFDSAVSTYLNVLNLRTFLSESVADELQPMVLENIITRA